MRGLPSVKVIKFFRLHFSIFLILILVLFLHLYKGVDSFFWQVDEDIIGLTVKRILIEHRPQLIGFPFPGGIYPGPIIYYVLSIPYALTSMNPAALPLIVAAIATFTTFVVFKVGTYIFHDSKAGLFASILFGFSFSSNIYSRFFNGLIFAPLLSLAAYMLLVSIIRSKKIGSILLLSTILIFSVQNEGSSISVFLLVLATLIIYKIKWVLKHFFILLTIFIAFHLPLLIFEIRHSFVLTEKFLYFLNRQTNPTTFLESLNTMVGNMLVFPSAFFRFVLPTGDFDVTSQILSCSEFFSSGIPHIPLFGLISSITLIALFYFCWRSRNLGVIVIIFHFVILLLGLAVYSLLLGSYENEWITVIFFPGFSLILGLVLSKIFSTSVYSKIIVYSLLVIFLFLNVKAIVQIKGRFGLSEKMTAVKYALSQVGGNSYYLDTIGACYSEGYNYLFWYLGNAPTYSKHLLIDPILVKQNRDANTKMGVVMVSHNAHNDLEFYKTYINYKARAINEETFGAIEVLIIQ